MADTSPKPDPKKPFGVAPGFVVRGSRPDDTRDMDEALQQMGIGAPLSDSVNTFNIGMASNADREEIKKMIGQAKMGMRRQNMRDRIAYQTATQLEDMSKALQNAGIPSTQGDIPLDVMIKQLEQRSPQMASQLTALKESAMLAINGYLAWSTMQGADPEERAPLAALHIPGQPADALTYNSLMAFYDKAGEYL